MLILIPTHFEAEMLFGSSVSRRISAGQITPVRLKTDDVHVSVTGFGLPAAGVGASKALSQYTASQSDKRVILAGTGGTYREETAPIGSAVFATRLRCLDVGIPACDGPNEWTLELGSSIQREAFQDCIELSDTQVTSRFPSGVFLSVATASRDSEMAILRLRQNPEALIEEMEGYSTAIACQTWETELTVCRGVSNTVGDRDRTSWRIEEAMLAVRDAILWKLEQSRSRR